MTIEPLIEHFRHRLAASDVRPDPMSHVVIDDVLPSEAYRAALAAIPPESSFSQRDRKKQDWRPYEPAPESAAMWQVLNGGWLDGVAAALVTRLREPLLAHSRALFGDVGAERAISAMAPRGGRVMLRRPGYRLHPHRDPLPGFLTFLYYLARPGDVDERYGTQLYRVAEDDVPEHSKTFYPREEQCTLAQDVAYRPNRAIAFLNTVGGAHGAAIPITAPADLERYSFQAYIGVDVETLAGLVSSMPADAQQRWSEKYRAGASA